MDCVRTQVWIPRFKQKGKMVPAIQSSISLFYIAGHPNLLWCDDGRIQSRSRFRYLAAHARETNSAEPIQFIYQHFLVPTNHCIHPSLVCICSIHCDHCSLLHSLQADQFRGNQEWIELAAGTGWFPNPAWDFDCPASCGNCSCVGSSSGRIISLRADDLFHPSVEIDGSSEININQNATESVFSVAF